MAGTAEAKKLDSEAPIILDLGRRRRKQVKRLTRGTGKLMAEVTECIEELKTTGKLSGSVQPVIVVVKERPKMRKMLFPGM